MKRLLLGAVLVATIVVATATAASAHPLGNFSVNRYAGVVIGAHAVDVDYVIDYAELPTYQMRHRYDPNDNGRADAAERDRFSATTCASLARHVELFADTQRLRTTVGGHRATLRPG